MKLTLGTLFASPDFHLFALEAERALFMRMDRDAYRRSIFLDARVKPADPAPLAVPIEPVLAHAASRSPARLGWIFHVAQCGSTLLARALDQANTNLVLREPMTLRQLGVRRVIGAGDQRDWAARLRLATLMAGRRYACNLPTIVKANVPVNFMLEDIAQADPDAPALFLYFGLESYLLATLRSEGHRKWVRGITTELAPALPISPGHLSSLTDARCAALLWAAQIRRFEAAMSSMPCSASVDANTLFAHPQRIIGSAAAMFGNSLSAEDAEAIAASELFATYSKNPAKAFDNEARLARQAELEPLLAEEIADARCWLADQGLSRELPERLDRPLSGEAPLLLSPCQGRPTPAGPPST